MVCVDYAKAITLGTIFYTIYLYTTSHCIYMGKQKMLACDEKHRDDFKVLSAMKHMSMKDYLHQIIDGLMKEFVDGGGKK